LIWSARATMHGQIRRRCVWPTAKRCSRITSCWLRRTPFAAAARSAIFAQRTRFVVAGGRDGRRNLKLHLLTAVLAFSTSRKTDLIRKTTVLTHPAVPHSRCSRWASTANARHADSGFVPRKIADALGATRVWFLSCRPRTARTRTTA
jgi:hypothetical protein